jgi:hypothetical protein
MRGRAINGPYWHPVEVHFSMSRPDMERLVDRATEAGKTWDEWLRDICVRAVSDALYSGLREGAS